MSIRRNPYRTRYIAWHDIGQFREITTKLITSRTSSGELKVQPPSGQSRFRLDLPPGFNSNRSIAFSEGLVRYPTLTPKAVIYRTKVWVCGTYFVGRLDLMYRWTQDYLSSYEWLIKNNLTNTDEQVSSWETNIDPSWSLAACCLKMANTWGQLNPCVKVSNTDCDRVNVSFAY